MKGLVEVDIATGAVTSKLSSQAEDATYQELSNDQLKQIGTNLTNMLQDVNLFMKQHGGEGAIGAFQKMTLKLDEHHFVNIVLNEGKIQALVEEASHK